MAGDEDSSTPKLGSIQVGRLDEANFAFSATDFNHLLPACGTRCDVDDFCFHCCCNLCGTHVSVHALTTNRDVHGFKELVLPIFVFGLVALNGEFPEDILENFARQVCVDFEERFSALIKCAMTHKMNAIDVESIKPICFVHKAIPFGEEILHFIIEIQELVRVLLSTTKRLKIILNHRGELLPVAVVASSTEDWATLSGFDDDRLNSLRVEEQFHTFVCIWVRTGRIALRFYCPPVQPDLLLLGLSPCWHQNWTELTEIFISACELSDIINILSIRTVVVCLEFNLVPINGIVTYCCSSRCSIKEVHHIRTLLCPFFIGQHIVPSRGIEPHRSQHFCARPGCVLQHNDPLGGCAVLNNLESYFLLRL